MDKITNIKANMIQLQLEIVRDQEQLHKLKNQLKDRHSILYALTAELDQLQEKDNDVEPEYYQKIGL